MPSTVLLASRKLSRLTPYIFTLRMAGYMTLDLSRLEAVAAIAGCNVLTAVIVDQTFSPAEQAELIRQVQQVSRRTHMITLQSAPVPAQELVRTCAACRTESRYGSVHVLGVPPQDVAPQRKCG
jgi:hypothetical protein